MKERSGQIWKVDLAQHWRGVTLPSVYFERFAEDGAAWGRIAVSSELLSQATWINLNMPVHLQTHREEKPWGAEIWYSGIETRGVCSVRTHDDLLIPLPEYLALLAGPNGQIQTPPLLKILDPLAEQQRGNLYIEVHQEKWETYIVTHVSLELYPDGRGQLLYGFCPAKLAEFFGDKAAFRESLIHDVGVYEAVRRVLDGERSANSLPQWLSAADGDLSAQAEKLWQKVKSYFSLRVVRVGDVICVPPYVAHSLQPGVRVVEFQTPTYERLILAFNQKVLTQAHWDTRRAVELASFETENVQQTAASLGRWLKIVDFPQFAVHKCIIEADSEVLLPQLRADAPSLLYVISSELRLSVGQDFFDLSLSVGQAVLLPPAFQSSAFKVYNCSRQSACVLLV